MRPGVKFKNISSRDLGLTMRTVNWPIIPSSTRSIVNVPNRPGSVDFGTDTYLDGDATLVFSWICKTPAEALEKGETLSGWLHNDGEYYELINLSYPTRKYYAKVTSAVPMMIDPCVGSVTVTFTFNPPYPFALDNSPISPQDEQDRLLWDTAAMDGNTYVQTFETNGDMRFTLTGTGTVKPVIRVVGYIPSGFNLVYGAQQWQYNALLAYDGIKIDCENETVTRMSDGESLFGYVSPADFFVLSPGQIQFSVSGVAGAFPKSLTIAVELSPNYGG